MSNESENANTSAAEAPATHAKRKSVNRAKSAKMPARTQKTVGKPAAPRSKKKSEVIAMMKRAKGATLTEITKAAGFRKIFKKN